eukprot:8434486-Pyramimonas_sp.AAC.1
MHLRGALRRADGSQLAPRIRDARWPTSPRPSGRPSLASPSGAGAPAGRWPRAEGRPLRSRLKTASIAPTGQWNAGIPISPPHPRALALPRERLGTVA